MNSSKQLELLFSGPPRPRPQQLLGPEEIFALADADTLKIINEDRRIERKPASFAVRALGDYVVMWANTQPSGGLVVVGMEDDGPVSGCTRVGQDRVNRIENVATDFCPEARILTRRIAATNEGGKLDYLTLILVRYRPDRLVRNSKGEAFVRIGDRKIQLSDEQIREYEIDRRQIDFEQEPTTLE